MCLLRTPSFLLQVALSLQEIYTNGPITGMFFVHRSFLSYKSGVYKAGFFFKDPKLYWLVASSATMGVQS